MSKVIFSGIQPTGTPHLGNYLGAMKQWVAASKTLRNTPQMYCIVDLHAITMPQDPHQLRTSIVESGMSLLAAGLDPMDVVIFKQSDVHQHAELAWILSCQTSIGALSGMTQYKEKGAAKEAQCLGLLAYPVLQAADILLYKTTHVPVGDDQRQHLELARDIARTFNHSTASSILTVPEAVYSSAPRIMSLKDPAKKMSKSDPNPSSRIHINDSPDSIRNKIRKATTDSINGLTYDNQNRPAVANLIRMYSELTNLSIQDVCDKFASSSTVAFKDALAEAAITELEPVNARYEHLVNQPEVIRNVLEEGAEVARKRAAETMAEIKKVIGFV